MGEQGLKVQIDEFLFWGKRKYNWGRLYLGKRRPREKLIESGYDKNADTEITNKKSFEYLMYTIRYW